MKLILLFIILILSGCSSNPKILTKIEYVEVKIPVSVIPAPPLFDKPKLEIHSFNELSPELQTFDELAKAYVITIHQLLNYSNQMELYLDKQRELANNP